MHQVPRYGPRVDVGGPYEYLHSPQAEQRSASILLSRVQNLQDQDFDLVLLPLSFMVPQTSQIRAIGCKRKNGNWNNSVRLTP